jgi:hypothetical protein
MEPFEAPFCFARKLLKMGLIFIHSCDDSHRQPCRIAVIL